jgi:hypothetical protein
MTEDERRIAGSIRAAASREWARVEEEGGASSSDVGYDEDSRASRLKRSTKCVSVACTRLLAAVAWKPALR